jgi:hypothetical protein
MKAKPPRAQLADFIAKYSPEIGSIFRAALVKMRKLLPGAVEMVYDNYNALVVGFGPTERPSEAIFSIAAYPGWVSVFFLQGAGIPDPQRILKGSGTRARHIKLQDASDLDKQTIRSLIATALDRAVKPLDESNPRQIIVKSISKKQRPRRPA